MLFLFLITTERWLPTFGQNHLPLTLVIPHHPGHPLSPNIIFRPPMSYHAPLSPTATHQIPSITPFTHHHLPSTNVIIDRPKMDVGYAKLFVYVGVLDEALNFCLFVLLYLILYDWFWKPSSLFLFVFIDFVSKVFVLFVFVAFVNKAMLCCLFMLLSQTNLFIS